MKTKKKQPIIQPYGNVGVDSGQLLIIDPCYLEDFMKLYSYEDICNYSVMVFIVYYKPI